jgi:hypothetical protein
MVITITKKIREDTEITQKSANSALFAVYRFLIQKNIALFLELINQNLNGRNWLHNIE